MVDEDARSDGDAVPHTAAADAPVHLLAVAAPEDGIEEADPADRVGGHQQAEPDAGGNVEGGEPELAGQHAGEPVDGLGLLQLGARLHGEGVDGNVVGPGRHRADPGVGLRHGDELIGEVGGEYRVGVGDEHVVVAGPQRPEQGEVHVPRDPQVAGRAVVAEAEMLAQRLELPAPAGLGAGVVEHEGVDVDRAAPIPEACHRLQAGGNECLAVVDENGQEQAAAPALRHSAPGGAPRPSRRTGRPWSTGCGSAPPRGCPAPCGGCRARCGGCGSPRRRRPGAG